MTQNSLIYKRKWKILNTNSHNICVRFFNPKSNTARVVGVAFIFVLYILQWLLGESGLILFFPLCNLQKIRDLLLEAQGDPRETMAKASFTLFSLSSLVVSFISLDFLFISLQLLFEESLKNFDVIPILQAAFLNNEHRTILNYQLSKK